MVIIWLMIIIYWLVVEPTPLKNDGVKVSWDDEIPNQLGIYTYQIFCDNISPPKKDRL
jgi:hypothetical protein